METGTSGDNATYEFPVITEDEKARILAHLAQKQDLTELKEVTMPKERYIFRRQGKIWSKHPSLLSVSWQSFHY